jgi:hypothetical protein
MEPAPIFQVPAKLAGVALTVVLVFAVDPTDVVVVGKLNFAGGGPSMKCMKT